MMKVLGLILPLALVAVSLQVGPHGQPAVGDSIVTTGIDGGGRPEAVCDRFDSTWPTGCSLDDSKRIVVSAIDGTD